MEVGVATGAGIASALEVEDLDAGLGLILDELAHGILLVSRDGRLLHANQAARRELARRQALSVQNDHVSAVQPDQARALLDAVARAAGGRRSLVTLDAPQGGYRLSVAAIPLRGDPTRIALMLSRAAVCDTLMLCFFARSHGLTPSEEQVLGILCQGYSAPEIAQQLRVAVSTVRSHVRSLCAKTQSSGVRTLVSRVAVLPPLGPSTVQEAVH